MNGMIVTDKEQASGHCGILVQNTESLTTALTEFAATTKDLQELGVAVGTVDKIIDDILRIQKQGEEAITEANQTMVRFISEADEIVNMDIAID